MKKTIIVLFAILITSNPIAIRLFSQTNRIGVNLQYSDSTRILIIGNWDKEKCLGKMVEAWGSPFSSKNGNTIWKNIELNGIGTNLTILVLDGIFARDATSARFTTFKNEKDKLKKLANLKANESRHMKVEIRDSNEKNIINSKAMENKAVDNLSNLLKDVN